MTRPFASSDDYAARRRPEQADAVACGTRVTVSRGILVSDLWIVEEAAAQPRRRRIAASTPLARALIGARVGDSVEYQDGGRTEDIRVLAIAREG